MKKLLVIITLTLSLVFTGVTLDSNVVEASTKCCTSDGGGTPPVD